MTCCRGKQNNKRIGGMACPLCKEIGDNIHYLAIRELVKKDLVKNVVEGLYFTCANKDCDLVFYREDENIIFLVQDINMEADFNQVVRGQGCNNCRPNI